ncbi:cytochrome P450 [Gloeopeniophorella convolvens]|nr:cytochrome P450 [Gloeopeniophorella convolvens]
MLALLLKLTAYIFGAVASTTLFVFARHRLKQRCLWRVAGPSSPSFIWGHWRDMFSPFAYPFHEGLYQTYGRVARVYGLFGDIQLVISDPKACSNIFVKDQAIFEETRGFLDVNMQAFGPALVSTQGAHHRQQRKLLNPVFNIVHMRYMIPIFHRVTRQLCGILDSIAKDGPQEVDISDWMGNLALELIGQAGLGYNFGTLDGRNDEFSKAFKGHIPAISSLAVYRYGVFPYIYKIFPSWLLKPAGRLLPWKKLNHLMDLAEIMNSSARRIYETKKKLLEQGDGATVEQIEGGKDILSVLMQANTRAAEGDRLSEEEVLAQITVLLLAATDTTSSALSRILHLLSLHPHVQDKLRSEITEACKDNGELSHDELVSLSYMDALCRETLRLYAPVPGVLRTTRGNTLLPLSAPIHDRDGSEIRELFIPDNTDIYVHIYNLNRDPLIWGPDAAEWKPEHWLSPLPESVAEAKIQGIYSNTMTFIGGPRSCIGFKFSQLEMKVVLSHLIPAFRFAPSKSEIIWRFGGITSPTVKGSTPSFHPKLPIVISRV